MASSPSSADLFAAHHDQIQRYILSMVKDPATAEDLTQDVFLQVHRHLASVRDPHALVSWL
jgi:DNA-directed RNA polymerase specialized sigma24 family protein